MSQGQEILCSTSFSPQLTDVMSESSHIASDATESLEYGHGGRNNIGHVEKYRQGRFAICQLLEFERKCSGDFSDAVFNSDITEVSQIVALIEYADIGEPSHLTSCDKEPMLISPVEFVEVVDGIGSLRISSLVQLHLIEKEFRQTRNGWSYNFISLQDSTLKFLPFFAHRKVAEGIVAVEPPNHRIPQNVERASKIVNDVAQDQWNGFWKWLNVNPYEWMSTLRVFLFSDRVEIRVAKPSDAILKGFEMLVSTSNFFE